VTGLRTAAFVGLLAAGCASETDVHLLEPATRPVVLQHRYDFDGRGAVLADLVGDADGEVLGGALLSDTGALELDGVDDYVNLPNDLLGDASAVSLVAWVTWRGGACWQRIFDFGRSSAGEDVPWEATSSVFVTPATCSASHVGPVTDGVLSTMFHAGQSVQVSQGTTPLPIDREVQVVLTLDAATGLRLYADGELLAEMNGETDPSRIVCENDWLGRSQWGHDALFFGSFHEFRVYSGALTAEDIASLFDRGPDSP
jgi:arabinan endo-1,5-alpha-L-arabinosidase